MNERQCDGCTKCCEGWLYGQAYDHKFYKGRPCFFLSKTCTIYDTRPENPCRSYKCAWLAEDSFPQWMKPNLVNIIITRREVENLVFYEILEAGSTIEAKTLNWLIQWAITSNKNILYEVDGGSNRLGSDEFLKLDI